MSRSASPINDPCCTKPPNPWLAGSQGPQGCVCDANCIGPQGPIKIRYERSVSPKHSVTVERKIAYLDSVATAFAGGAPDVNTRLNAAIQMPNSNAATLAAIPSQNAAAVVNAKNALAVIAPQAASVAAASSSFAAATAARLAYRAASQGKDAVDKIKNVNMDELSVYVLNAKLSTDALLAASISSNNAAQGVYNTAASIQGSANDNVTSLRAALTQIEVDAAVASCNAVPGSGGARLTEYENQIAVTTARRRLELATTAATAAASAADSCNTVAISVATALVAANTASAKAIIANNYFTDAAAKTAAYNAAIQAYSDSSSNVLLRTAAHDAKVLADAANALLPPVSAMNDVLTTTAQASYLANIAGANAKTLSTSLDVQAKAAAAPLYKPITPQMIATQTAAAERFGAAAAAAASRAARASAAPPVPEFIPAPRNAMYSARVPPRSIIGDPTAAQTRAEQVARALATNPWHYTCIFKH